MMWGECSASVGLRAEVGLPIRSANWQQVVAQSPRRVASTVRSAVVLVVGIAPGGWTAMISRIRFMRSQWLLVWGLSGSGCGLGVVFIGGLFLVRLVVALGKPSQ